MIYAGIDVNIITHERATEAGVEAFGLWCWGMCWAQIHKSDGRLPRIMVLAALRGRRNIMLAARLVAAGLWIAHEDGSWTIRNYTEKNQTSLEIAAKLDDRRKANAARQRKFKALQALANEKVTLGNGPITTTPLPLQTPLPDLTPVTDEVEPVTAVIETGARFRYRDAYCSGIAKGKGTPFAWPSGPVERLADEDLGKAILTFARSRSTGKALRGDELLGWIDAAADDFAAFVTAAVREGKDDAKYWSNFRPKGLLRFLNQDSRAEEARDVG